MLVVCAASHPKVSAIRLPPANAYGSDRLNLTINPTNGIKHLE
jgi:hypothetical protein